MRAQRPRVHHRFAARLRDLDLNRLAFLHQREPGTQRQLERALGTLHRDGLPVHGGGYALGQRDRLFCDS